MAATNGKKAKYMLLVSIDACRADYLDMAEMPNIRSMMKEGVSYNNAWVGQLQNVTPPVHATFGTGTLPKNNGIVSFGWRDVATNKPMIMAGWKKVKNGDMGKYLKEMGVTSVGTLYKQAYPGSKVVSLSSNRFHAAAAMGAQDADYIIYNDRTGGNPNFKIAAEAKVMGQDPNVYGGKADVVSAATDLSPTGIDGHVFPDEVMKDPALRMKRVNLWDGDTWGADMAIRILDFCRPEVFFVNMAESDSAGHLTGAGRTKRDIMVNTLVNVDKQIGRIVDWYKKAGIYDETIFVITSDHGMGEGTGTVSHEAIKAEIQKVSQESAFFIFPEMWLFEPDKAKAAAENLSRANLNGVHAVYYKEKARNGEYEFRLVEDSKVVKPGSDLDKCYRYLGWTYARDSSPDIILAIRENWNLDNDTNNGNHDNATIFNQAIPLVFVGPGFGRGKVVDSPARAVDIPFTVMTAIGVEPKGMDGIVLADALLSPSKDQVDKQKKISKELAPMVKALREQAMKDIGK